MAHETRPIKNPIRIRRKRVGLTIVELASLLDVNPARIVQFESGHKPPDERLETIARILGVEVDQLRDEYANYRESLHNRAMEKVGLGAAL